MISEQSDWYTRRLLELGIERDRELAAYEISRCNCMVRYSAGPQLPAIRSGKKFTDPKGNAIVQPDSFEDMTPKQIAAMLKQNDEIYIGHMFTP